MSRGIVTAGDAKYYPGIIALINSIKKYHQDEYPISVLDGGVTRQQVDTLEEANIVVIKPELIVDLEHPRYACSNIIFEMDRAGYDKILFLDSDIILINDIDEIFNLIEKHKSLILFYDDSMHFIHFSRNNSQIVNPALSIFNEHLIRIYKINSSKCFSSQ